MPAKCFSVVRGKRVRVTRTDQCGAPAPGVDGFVVSSGFISVGFTAEIEDEEEIQVKNANGDICILDTTCPSLKYYSLEIEFCDVDPELLSLMSGQDVVEDWEGNAVGLQIGEEISCDEGFALELWSGVPGVECDVGQTGATYGYFLVPWVVNGILGDFTIENDATTFSITGRSKKGHAWGAGPYDVVSTDGIGGEGPLLVPVPSTKHLHMQLTTVAPPEPMCGFQELTLPAGAMVGDTFRTAVAEGGGGGTATLTRTSQTVEEPNKSDSAAAWEKFAVSRGMSKEDAKKATKDDLIARYSSS